MIGYKIRETIKMPQHKRVPTLLSATLKRIEQLTTEIVLNTSTDIAFQAGALTGVYHEDIIEHTRNITNQSVDEIRDLIFSHVVQTIHQDASLHILKEST